MQFRQHLVPNETGEGWQVEIMGNNLDCNAFKKCLQLLSLNDLR